MSSSSSQKVNSPLMTVELLLKVNQDELGQAHSGKMVQRVLLELSLEEARDFVAGLTKIEGELVGTE